MLRLEQADNNPLHLYPMFREKLELALEQARRECRGKHGVEGFVLFEGYRSPDRQKWLYTQGRTRPGPVVTWTLHSRHCSAAAADCYPTDSLGRIIWDAHASIWDQYGHCCRSQSLYWGGDGLPGPGGVIDRPHVQLRDEEFWSSALGRAAFIASLRSED